jgi:hypothetical protein
MQRQTFIRKDLLPRYQVAAKEVVKVINDIPHLLVRMIISGGHFPHRAPHPFIHVRVGESEYFTDYFTQVSNDNASLVGYLPVNVPEKGVIEFGYGNEIWGTIAGEFLAESIPRLDKERLPRDILIVDEAFINRRKDQ